MATPRQRKPRSDSPLKTLPPERQEAIIEHMRNHKLPETRAWLRADGIKTSPAALSEFWSWWHLCQQFKEWEQDSNTMEQLLRQEQPQLSEEEISKYGNAVFQLRAIKQQDVEAYTQLMSARHRAVMDEKKLALRREELNLKLAQFQRDTCELFLKWRADARATEIADSPSTNKDKIERLGQLMFGEEWK